MRHVKRPSWLSLLLVLLVLAAGPHPTHAQTDFVAVAFHEVVQSPDDLNEDAVTADRLIDFFEFLLADGWTVLSLDDIAQAREQGTALPPKSVLLTFDDGYADLYTRVFPIIKAYNFPIVAALVGQWMDAPMSATVNYGGEIVPRTNFLSWSQARQMQASGLVEFASHSYDQHFSISADVHGTKVPAMVTYAFETEANRYEDPARFESRIRRDIIANNRLFKRELGKTPRAFVWPYGRYSLQTIEIAKSLGYTFALNLNDEPSRVSLPMEIARYLPERNPSLADMLDDVRHQPGFAPARRLMAFDIASLWDRDATSFDAKLGQFIEDVRDMAPTDVAFKPYDIQPDGSLSSWLHDQHVADPSAPATRVTWQLDSRAGVGVMAMVSLEELLQALGTPARVLAWFAELGREVPISGLVFEDATAWLGEFDQFGDAAAGNPAGPWDVRQQRRLLDASTLTGRARLALQAFRAVEQYRPTLDWVAMVDADPSGPVEGPSVSPYIDLLLVRSPDKLPAWVNAEFAASVLAHRRLGLWLGTLDSVDSATQATKLGQTFVAGAGSVLGWRVEVDAALDDVIGITRPAFSSATFPLRF